MNPRIPILVATASLASLCFLACGEVDMGVSPDDSLIVGKTKAVFDVSRKEWRSDPFFTVSKEGVGKTPDGEAAIRFEVKDAKQPAYINGPNFPVAKLKGLAREWSSLTFWVKPDDSGVKASITFCDADDQGTLRDNVFFVPLVGKEWQRMELHGAWSKDGKRFRLDKLSHMLITVYSTYGKTLDFQLGPLTFNLGGGAVGLSPVPSVDVPACGAAPVIDGKLEDPCWSSAAVIKEFVDLKNGTAIEMPFEVKITHGEDALLVGTRQKIDPSKLVRGQKTPQMDVWRDDSFCFFLSPNNDGRTYYQFIINSLGTTQGTRQYFDQVKDSFTFDGRWDGQWKSAAALDSEGWSVEIEIPYTCMTPAMKKGGIAGLQMGFINPSIGLTCCWAPVPGGSFLEPSRFGVMNMIPKSGDKPRLEKVTLQFDKFTPSVSLSIVPNGSPVDVQAAIANVEGAVEKAMARINDSTTTFNIPDYLPKSGAQRLTISLIADGLQRAVYAFRSDSVSFASKTDFGVDVLCPQPKSIVNAAGKWLPTKEMRIFINKNPSPAELHVAERLRNDLSGHMQLDLAIVEAAIPMRCIAIGATADSFPWQNLDIPKENGIPGAYYLEITPAAVAMAGADDQGLLYAALTLAQIERYAFLRNEQALSERSIRDWPNIPTRLFVHWLQGLTSRNCKVDCADIRAAEYKLIDRFIGDIKLNAFSLLAPDAILYDKPENRKVDIYPKATFMDIPALMAMRGHCEELGIEFIPALCGPSHCLWITIPYPELAMPGYSNWDANPTDERFFKVYFPVMNELIPTGNSKRFMIWNDEWWHQPKGNTGTKHEGVEKRDIFRATIERIHGHLKERGIQAVMFSDMLQKSHNGGVPYDNYLNAPLLPKDIVMGHWSNAKSAAGEFSSLGYAENWLVTNRFASHRISKADIKAKQITGCGIIAYSALSPDASYGYGSNLRVADYSWNLGDDDEMSLTDWMLSKGRNVMANASVIRNPAAARSFTCVDIGKSLNHQTGKLHPGLGALPAGEMNVGFIPMLLADGGSPAGCAMPNGEGKLTFDVGCQASSLIFLHAQLLPKEKQKEFLAKKNSYDYFDGVRIGSYIVKYTDGSCETVFIRSAENIGDITPYAGINCGVLENCYLADCRFTLELGSGDPGSPCLYQYEWVNPHPEKSIASIEMSSSGMAASPVLFAVTARGVLLPK